MSERKDAHRAAQEQFRRALTGEFEPVKAQADSQPTSAAPEAAPSGGPVQAHGATAHDGSAQADRPAFDPGRGPNAASPAEAQVEAVPASSAKRAVAARAERMRAQKRRQRRIVAIAAGVFVLVALGATLAFGFLGQSEGGNPLEGFFDESAQSGQAPNKTPAELQAELNRVVEEGMFNISIASVIEFADPDATGKAYIENVPNNPYDMTVEITLSETGETVYASKGVAPGNYIEDIQLTAALEPGSHNAVATFTAYDRETHAEKGKAAAEVVLLIGKGGDASG